MFWDTLDALKQLFGGESDVKQQQQQQQQQIAAQSHAASPPISNTARLDHQTAVSLFMRVTSAAAGTFPSNLQPAIRYIIRCIICSVASWGGLEGGSDTRHCRSGVLGGKDKSGDAKALLVNEPVKCWRITITTMIITIAITITITITITIIIIITITITITIITRLAGCLHHARTCC
jgi:hypothetical protein